MSTSAHQIEPATCQDSLTDSEFCAAVNEGLLNIMSIGERKYDGHRYLFQVRPNGAKHNFLTSRRLSKKTGLLTEKQEVMTYFRDCMFGPRDTVYDGEMVHPIAQNSAAAATAVAKDFATYKVYDIVRHAGKDVRNWVYAERRALLEKLAIAFPDRTELVPQSYAPQRLWRAMNAIGAEGIIIKDPHALYGKGWYKVVHEVTHDCVVVGFEQSTEGKYAKNGWIKSILIAQWVAVDKDYQLAPGDCGSRRAGSARYVLKRVGRASGFTEEIRAAISKNPDKYMHRAVKIEAKERLPSGLFRHPRFLEWRDDKNPEDCIWITSKAQTGPK